jgi:diacylglycerol kinase (ATP)
MGRIWRALLNSLNGLNWAFRNEPALRQEIILLVIALPSAIWLARDAIAFAALIGVILLLIAVELLNTAIEKLCDHVTPEHHRQIGRVKDIASAAVFIALALVALVWGAALWGRVFG